MFVGGKGLVRLAAGGLACLLAPLIAGCAPAARPVEPTTAYFRDAGQCSRQSQDITRVRIRVGNFRDDMPLELGLNGEKYKVCMESLGWAAPDPAKDPYFTLATNCRQSVSRSTQIGEGGTLRLQQTVDEAAYRECMRNNGVEGEVIVHPLELK
ncbi:MAG: hypothetical protein H6R26_2299 [Proteobacteria bacterium]|nr:hypothetical protein [Pseudomonadota bacterium]